ncbi:hypothetical protein LCGC14_2125260 [marine sediment metagenome]|uniref:Uncharacterized protein n=1 Tax=marine sediment metagenome TaxID=412755 RepID=A0A0F9E341_9ZZZZ
MPLAENIPTVAELESFRGRSFPSRKRDMMKSTQMIRFRDDSGLLVGEYEAEQLSKEDVQKALAAGNPNDVFDGSTGGTNDDLNLAMNLNFGILPNSPPNLKTELLAKSVDENIDQNSCFDSVFPF